MGSGWSRSPRRLWSGGTLPTRMRWWREYRFRRGKILFAATRIMQEQKEALARLLTREEGKALKDSLGEVQRAINILEFMAGEARRLNGETLTSELPKNFS